MSARRLHKLEIRPFRDTRVHAGAFERMVSTITNFDGLSQEEAAFYALQIDIEDAVEAAGGARGS